MPAFKASSGSREDGKIGVVRYHFSGIAGAGVIRWRGCARSRHQVQGSDRSFDQGKNRDVADSSARSASRCDPTMGAPSRVISIASFLGRRRRRHARDAPSAGARLERVARPALLAEIINGGHPSVAVAGTSGKSTITGMVAWLLRESVYRHGARRRRARRRARCRLLNGGPDGGPVIAEACESDGRSSAIGRPSALRTTSAAITPRSRHENAVRRLREELRKLLATPRVGSERPRPDDRRVTYGIAAGADLPLEVITPGPDRARGALHAGAAVSSRSTFLSGRTHLENAAAAALVALELGVPAAAIGPALARFPGVPGDFRSSAPRPRHPRGR